MRPVKKLNGGRRTGVDLTIPGSWPPRQILGFGGREMGVLGACMSSRAFSEAGIEKAHG